MSHIDQMPQIHTGSFLTKEQAEQFREAFKNLTVVVRCKDCKNMKVLPCDIHGHIPIYCTNLGIYSEGLDWFCADGERRTE